MASSLNIWRVRFWPSEIDRDLMLKLLKLADVADVQNSYVFLLLTS